MELKFNRKSIVVVILTMYTNARHTPNVFLIFNFKLQKKKNTLKWIFLKVQPCYYKI